VRWHLLSTCLLGAWLGTTGLASAGPAPVRTAPVVRWQVPLPGWGEPAADDSAAYFLTRTHEVVSIDAASGSIRWRTDTGGAGEVPTGTQVRLVASRVLVGDGAIVAFDRASGRRTWRFEAPDGDDPGVFLGAVDADLVVAGSPLGRVYAVDTVSGTLRWTRDVTAGRRRVVFAPVHAGALVVAAFTTFDGPLSGGLIAFDRSGRRQWTHPFDTGAGAAGPPIVIGDVVVVARTDGRIEAVRALSGRRVWVLGPEASPPGGVAGRDIRALASYGDQLVATSLHGPIRGYDIHSRRPRWEYGDSPDDAVALRVRLYGDQLYVPYSDGSLVALDPRTGTERWRAGDGSRSFDWPPAASATSIFASAADALWAFRIHPLDTASRPDRAGADH
jgi:outer membrane protein assembly factor BamB